MSESNLTKRIEALRNDFASVRGKPFEHFYCPILMRDEQTEICCGHIVNKALATVASRFRNARTLTTSSALLSRVIL